MSKKTKILTTLIVIVAVVCVALLTYFLYLAPEKILTIGITQIVDHPALNAVRDGFIDEMTKQGYIEDEKM
jgi:putative ABC transport system substrate-binding protein